MRIERGWVFVAALAALGCHAPSPAESPPEPESAGLPDAPTDTGPSPQGKDFEIHQPLAALLAERRLSGSIVLYDVETRQLLCSAEGACDVPLGPASTYKIPHSLIGLELGELESPDHSFKWDGKEYSVPAWNQDHTLRSAMEVSCVPCFQQLARRIGEDRMTVALRELDYGNGTLGGPLDQFWLEAGGLRITPRQQVEFLYRLQTRQLPFSAWAMDTTVEVIPKTEGQGTTLRGKTGMYGSQPPVGWYVGWLEWNGGVTFFATALHGDNDPEKLVEARREVSVAALRSFTGNDQLE